MEDSLKLNSYYIQLKYATFLLTVDTITREVVDAPPIAKWTRGKLFNVVLDYYKSRDEFIDVISLRGDM